MQDLGKCSKSFYTGLLFFAPNFVAIAGNNNIYASKKPQKKLLIVFRINRTLAKHWDNSLLGFFHQLRVFTSLAEPLILYREKHLLLAKTKISMVTCLAFRRSKIIRDYIV